jgi:predicted RNA-binding protein with PIN domain
MERLIVDGYNLVHADVRYAALLKEDIDAARARLIADLAAHATGGRRVTVVFDGGANPISDGSPHHVAGIAVIFSPAGESADTVIESLAARSRERGEATVVVTSDSATREAVRSGSVSVLSSSAFASELLAERGEQGERAKSGARRVPLEDRIDPDVRAVLARWARG